MDNIMTDEELEQALDDLAAYADNDVKRSLAQLMNEHQIITWEEAEQILADTGDEPIKCSLPQQTRPTEPDNDTNVDQSIQQLLQNDPKLSNLNLNNMKRLPIPQIKRIITAMRENEYIEKLSLANMGLYDTDIEPLIDILEENESLRVLNLETNYLSGEFFAKLFQAALKNQTLEEVKAVNQGVSFSTTSERDIIKAIFQNRGLLKVSFNFRLPEGRHKVEQATMRNQEIRRILRRQAAEEARLEEERKKVLEKPPPKKEPVVIKTAPSILKTAGAREFTNPPRILGQINKPDSEVSKWRRSRIPEEQRPETSDKISSKPSDNPVALNNAPNDSSNKPSLNGDASIKKKSIVKKSSSSEAAIDGAEPTKPRIKKKKKPQGIAPVIAAATADLVPSSNSVNEETLLLPIPKSSLPETQTSDSEPVNNTGLTVSRDNLVITSATSATSATSVTSETDAPDVSSSMLKKTKKKVVRRKKRVPPTTEMVENLAEQPEGRSSSPVKQPEQQQPSSKELKEEDKPLESRGEQTLSEDGAGAGAVRKKVKVKKIVRKKKRVPSGEEGTKLNGTEAKSDDLIAATPLVATKGKEEPRKVFSKSRLYGAANSQC